MSAATTGASLDPTLQPLGEQPEPVSEQAQAAAAMGIGVDLAPRRPRISSTWLLLVGSVAIAGGVLWGMRWVGMKGGMTGKDVKFDATLLEAASRPKRDHSGVLDDLKSSRVSQQVPGDSVKKNPFRIADSMAGMFPVIEAPIDNRPDPALAAAAAKAVERQRAIHSALANLKIQTIMGGKSPVARVSGKLVRIGDLVVELFTVRAIHGRSIELEADGKLYELAMTTADLNE
jgi:hypothetical protein